MIYQVAMQDCGRLMASNSAQARTKSSSSCSQHVNWGLVVVLQLVCECQIAILWSTWRKMCQIDVEDGPELRVIIKGAGYSTQNLAQGSRTAGKIQRPMRPIIRGAAGLRVTDRQLDNSK